ncbi:MAG: hypothetical protein IPL65_08950 [Lewinellaceae bacterium]|nr:hypothetical protein [Lewinellaceae bacterium]
MLALHYPELSRMRLLHRRPQYSAYVSEQGLQRMLRSLFTMFPTLVVLEHPDGKIQVRLYKYYEGRRLPRSIHAIRRMASPVKRSIRPGTTKWFLLQEMAQE